MDYTNKHPLVRLLILIFGLALFALGICMCVNANLGLAPWDIFHQGISRNTGLTLGMSSLVVGLVILIFNFILKEKVGIGTILNVFLIGIIMDIIFKYKIVPEAKDTFSGLLLLIGGGAVIGLASYFYMTPGLGAGPRDGLMVILTKRTGIDVAIVRNSIETIAAISGYLMGGSLGLGTVISALTLGYWVKLAFRLFNTDIKSIKHDYLDKEGIKHFLNSGKKN